MLDRDLAKLYQVETRIINQATKRNKDRFPEKFCLRLTKEEISKLNSKSQIVILKNISSRVQFETLNNYIKHNL